MGRCMDDGGEKQLARCAFVLSSITPSLRIRRAEQRAETGGASPFDTVTVTAVVTSGMGRCFPLGPLGLLLPPIGAVDAYCIQYHRVCLSQIL